MQSFDDSLIIFEGARMNLLMRTMTSYGRFVLLVTSLTITLSACGTTESVTTAEQDASSGTLTTANMVTSVTASPQPTPQTAQPVVQATPQRAQPGARQGGQQPSTPACAFGNDASAPAEPKTPSLEAYTFSEPKVVLTSPRSIGINEWLPDNQRLLVTRSNTDGSRETFEIFDVRTGATELYAEHDGPRTKPVWLAAEQAVAFTTIRSNFQEVALSIGRGKGAPVEELATDLGSPFLAPVAGGKEIAFATKNDQMQLRVMAAAQGQRQERLITPPLRAANAQPRVVLDAWQAMRTAWKPDGSMIAMYNKQQFFLVDAKTSQICTVDLGSDHTESRWALDVRWSPDGRYLAARTSMGGRKGQLAFTDLTVIDTATGQLRYIDLGVQYVDEFAWLPNSRQLIAFGLLDANSEYFSPSLFITDVSSGDFRHVLPNHIFGGGLYEAEGGGLALSSDGQRIALRCSLTQEDRLCFVDIRT
jgi:WD40 repeat protein